jgi:hypothetical protein
LACLVGPVQENIFPPGQNCSPPPIYIAEWRASTPLSSMFSLRSLYKTSHTNYWQYTEDLSCAPFDLLFSAPTEEKGTTSQQPCVQGIEEARSASKSSHSKFGYYLSISWQAVYH